MTFAARIVRHSPVWRLWHEARRTGGVVSGVQFRWTEGGEFVTGALAPAQVAALHRHASVQLEAIGVEMPTVDEPALEPASEPAPAPERGSSTLHLNQRPPKAGNDRRPDIGGGLDRNSGRGR